MGSPTFVLQVVNFCNLLNFEMNRTSLRLRDIKQEDFPTLIYLEEYIFPTGACTPDRLSSIYLSEPHRAQFGMIYDNTENGKLAAMCAILALNLQGYEKLLHGKCRELELDPVNDFFTLPPSDKMKTFNFEISLHVYHIDKLDPNISGFFRTMLRDLSKIIENLRIQIKTMYDSASTLTVHSFSAYSVTKAGVALFEKTLGCVEQQEFPGCEHLLFRKKTESEETEWLLIETNRNEDAESVAKRHETWTYSNKCKFLATYPTSMHHSIVWDNIKGNDSKPQPKL
jgi:hypothetical protein